MRIDADVRRVALLARPGLARERLSTVLDEAGAVCVLTADPTELDPAALIELEPQLVVVALDPLTEEVLELFDAVLGDPSVDVIYEEAEQAASREGWDAARWQRHLVAKLQGHGNVLPPGREPSPGMAVDAGGSLGPAPDPVESSDFDVSNAVALTDVADAPAAAMAGMFDPVNAELDGFDAGAGSGLPLESRSPMPGETSPSASELLLSLESLEAEDPLHDEPAVTAVTMQEHEVVADFDFSFELAGDEPGPVGAGADALDDGGFAGFDPVSAEAMEPAVESAHVGIDLALAPEYSEGGEGTVIAAVAPKQELSLEDHDLATMAGSHTDSSRPDLAGLHARISTLELVDDAPGEKIHVQPRERGAVLILSGLGGPDAVRQLLGALPPGFTRPVLVRQHLDGGRYDRLVTQLQRATALPVELA